MTTLEPKWVLMVAVKATQLPAASAAEMWVVCLGKTSVAVSGGAPWVAAEGRGKLIFAERAGVFLADQRARDAGESRIAQPIGAVGKSPLHRFDDEMGAVERREVPVGKPSRLEHVQDFEKMNAAGTGRWKGDHGVAPVIGGNRLAQEGAILVKILLRQEALIFPHPFCGGLGKRA